jgi:dTDP-4-dehydrorhamnose reductase
MKIIVLGNGNAGSYIYSYLSKYFECKLFSRIDFDAIYTDFNFIKNIINSDDIVINCVGILKPKISHIGIENTFLINSVFPNKLYEICKLNNAHFVHICSDCVFKGDKGNYTENSLTDATDTYAQSKSLVKKGIIIRTSFIGEYSGLLKWVISNKNNVINGYDNCIWNGITTLELAKFIKKIINLKLLDEKVIHIFSNKKYSKYELCKLINKIYNLNLKINKISAKDIEGTKINKLLDRSLKSNLKFYNLIEGNLEKQIKEIKSYII